jgi:glycerophosphoryl diester phosphodiesterase
MTPPGRTRYIGPHREVSVVSEEVVPAPRLRQYVSICAHRGACELAPQNTIPAFEKAIELGCDSIEIDVQAAADGEAVVIHNSTLDATTNGTGEVSSFTLEQIRALDAGSKFSPRFAGTTIPTLAETFECCRGRAFVVLEVKRLSVDTLLRVINDCRARDHVVILTGVDWLAELRAADPGLPVMGQPWHVDEVMPVMDRLKPEYMLVRWKPGQPKNTFYPHIIAACHARGAQICQNVLGEKDTPEGIRGVITAGVDFIETDKPGLAYRVAGEMGAVPPS